jgi:hypothetical protein
MFSKNVHKILDGMHGYFLMLYKILHEAYFIEAGLHTKLIDLDTSKHHSSLFNKTSHAKRPMNDNESSFILLWSGCNCLYTPLESL